MMAQCSEKHIKLEETGEGKCSVPMWMNGLPAGFCDEPAYGRPEPCKTVKCRDGKSFRMDGRYDGYVPGLACHAHGGPKHRRHLGDPCRYCGTPHDDVAPGPCPGPPEGE
jgi:hypothetical protein